MKGETKQQFILKLRKEIKELQAQSLGSEDHKLIIRNVQKILQTEKIIKMAEESL